MSEVVNIDSATAEIDKWLDHKRINEKKREDQKSTIDSLIDAVRFGMLTVDEDFNLVQKLYFPIGNNQEVEELKYKPRIGVGTVHRHLKGLKADDADGRLAAYVAALTNSTKAQIAALDTEDYGVGQSIAIFFL